MAQIGEPQRIITVEPLYEPLPGKEIPDVNQPVEQPNEPVSIPDGK